MTAGVGLPGASGAGRPSVDESFDGAYLIVDIVGSSKIGAALAERGGRRGAERLGRLLDSAFVPIVAAIHGAGGSIVDVAGDAVHACWRADADVQGFPGRVAGAANALLAALDPRRVDGGAPVGVRLGLGFGGVALHAFGDGRSRIAAGDALVRAIAALDRARSGGLAIERSPIPLRPAPEGAAPRFAAETAEGRMTTPRARVASATDGDGETRTLTALAAELAPPGVALAAPVGRIVEIAEAAMAAVAPGALGLERPHLDEKGLTLLSLYAPESGAAADSGEALASAVEALGQALAPFGLAPRIGVATGRVFVYRVEAGALRPAIACGMPLVLATRLMEAAREAPLLDAATADLVRRRRIGVSEVARRRMKGFDEPVPLFSFAAAPAPAAPSVAAVARAPDGLVGRGAELAAIAAFFEPGCERRGLAIAGSPSTGKTALLDRAEDEAARRGAPTLRLERPSMRRGAPLSAWRPAIAGGGDGVAAADLEAATDLLLARWSRTAPVLLVDDAHALDEASAALLRRLWRALPGLRAVIAADPEAGGARLFRELFLDGASRLDLRPLTLAETEALLGGRLGPGRIDPDALAMLSAFCEGAPGALLDVASSLGETLMWRARSSSQRALGPSAQDIDLPPSVSQMVERRIAALSPGAGVVLKAASVAGGEIDRRMLGALGLGSAAAIDAGLDEAAAARLLLPAPEGDRWRCRTQLVCNVGYGMIAESAAAALHRAMAATIGADPSIPSDQRVALLAFHAARAGDAREAVRRLYRSAALSLRSGGHGEALRDLERALALAAEARAAGAPVAGPWREAVWRHDAARASLALGDIARARGFCFDALRLLRGPVARTEAGWAARLALAAPRLALRAAGRRGAVASSYAERRRLRGVAAVLLVISDCFYFRNAPLGMVASATLAAEALERVGARAEAARPYSSLGYAFGALGLERAGLRVIESGRRVAGEAGHLESQLYCVGGAALLAFGRGRIAEALPIAEEAVSLAVRRGEPYTTGMARTILALMLWHAGRFAASEAELEQLAMVARRSGNDQHLAWSLYATAAALLPSGATERAADLLDEAAKLVDLIEDDLSALNLTALRAQAAAEQGRAEAAASLAREALARATMTPPMNWGSFEGFFGPAEVLLAAATRARPGIERGGLAADAARAVKRGALFAWGFRFARPRLLQQRGALAALRGDAAAARARFSAALEEARRIGARHEAARALALLGAVTPGARGRRLAEEARRAAAALGAGFTGLPAAALAAPFAGDPP